MCLVLLGLWELFNNSGTPPVISMLSSFRTLSIIDLCRS